MTHTCANYEFDPMKEHFLGEIASHVPVNEPSLIELIHEYARGILNIRFVHADTHFDAPHVWWNQQDGSYEEHFDEASREFMGYPTVLEPIHGRWNSGTLRSSSNFRRCRLWHKAAFDLKYHMDIDQTHCERFAKLSWEREVCPSRKRKRNEPDPCNNCRFKAPKLCATAYPKFQMSHSDCVTTLVYPIDRYPHIAKIIQELERFEEIQEAFLLGHRGYERNECLHIQRHANSPRRWVLTVRDWNDVLENLA